MTEPTARDVQLDEWVHDHPDTLIVFGAGNNGFEDYGFNPGSVQSPATGKTAMTAGGYFFFLYFFADGTTPLPRYFVFLLYEVHAYP